MNPTQSRETPDENMIPNDAGTRPEVTIRSQATGFLTYDIDPNQIPTETITRGGRRIVIDETGSLCECDPEDRSHYEVLDKISEGGMGIVYSVEEKSLKREVALKICRAGGKPEASGSSETGEFTNEAYMTARLDHPGVVPIYALAKDAEGRPFFAMKRVSGTSWNDLLHPEKIRDPARREAVSARARQMTWKDHLHVLLKVCDAVAYAHSKAILHRDLKPENIMLGEYGEVYVMDWGLAIYFDERNEYKRFPDLKPQLAGTPSYIAPEMVRGQMTSLCPASDVYLLGGILYEIMTGRPPHDGETVMDTLRMAAKGHVLPPEEVSDSPVITPALSRIAMKALAGPIAERYPSVEAFQQDLRDILAHSESMAIGQRAAELLAEVRRRLRDECSPDPHALNEVDEDSASVCYGQLSECIGSFRQALALWNGNQEARQALVDALGLQIRLAIQQDDLTLARAQSRLLEAVKADCPDPVQTEEMDRQVKELAVQIERRQIALDRSARQVRRWKIAAGGLAVLVLAGLAAIVGLSLRQRSLAIQNEKNMFSASVVGHAEILSQFMGDVEQIVMLYRQTAVELLSSPASHLPWREPTPAGRDGFYLDEDFLNDATRPPGMAFNQRYGSRLSMDFPTTVISTWARDPEHRPAAEDAAARLGRLNGLFTHFHRTQRDILWSVAGSTSGAMVSFPGFARYQNQPDFDVTRAGWVQAAIQSTNDRPEWGRPYADAISQTLLMGCTSRLLVDGQTVGAVGLEVTLGTLQRMMLDFSLAVGGTRRSLLIRTTEEVQPETGNTVPVHRIVVDTLKTRTVADWESRADLPTIDQSDEFISTYFQEVLDRQHKPGECVESGPYWLVHMPIRNRTWTFIAILQNSP